MEYRETTEQHLIDIVAKAASEPEYLRLLLENPQAAADHFQVKLCRHDIDDLTRVFESLNRFVDGKVPYVEDAQNWSVGLMTYRRPVRSGGTQ